MPVTQKVLSIILSILLFFSSTASVWSGPVEKQAVLAALTLNVARFTRWPEFVFSVTPDTLNLCVFGDNVVQQSFNNIENKIINNKTIHIINISRLRNLNRCQLLYLSNLNRNKLIPLLVELKGKAILTVGENMRFLQAGGMVGLEKIKGKIQLSINLSMVKNAKLVISSRILKLANIVDFPSPTQ